MAGRWRTGCETSGRFNMPPIPSRVKDLSGQKFGRLTVVEFVGIDPVGNALWKCACDCGGFKVTTGTRLITKRVTSCTSHADLAIRGLIHGACRNESLTPEYQAWASARYRCSSSPTNPDKHRYWDRGIRFCKRWDDSFLAFLSDMGRRPDPKRSLDRINNDGSYEPGNCRWATSKEQANNRANSCKITYKGITKSLWEWSTDKGLGRNVLRRRLDSGMTAEEALEKPAKKSPRRHKQHGLEFDGVGVS